MRLAETLRDGHSDAVMLAVTLLLDETWAWGTQCAARADVFATDRHGPPATNRAISAVRGGAESTAPEAI